jgi:hypothetical protein
MDTALSYLPKPGLSILGHDEHPLGHKLAYCSKCQAKRPPDGWQKTLPGEYHA